MSDVSTEKRLRLLKQIRSRYNEDQIDLTNRERILYGRSSRPADRYEEPLEDGQIPDGQHSSFRLRLAVAIGLVGLIIFMDMRDVNLAGITADKIFQAISADFEERIEQWASDSQPPV